MSLEIEMSNGNGHRRRLVLVSSTKRPRLSSDVAEARNWHELPKSCLVNVFGRLELASMVLDVPFVCKSWYDAALDPLCWERLNFPDFGRSIKFFFPESPSAAAQAWRLLFTFNFNYDDGFDNFIKLVVDHSQGLATYLNPPSNCSSDALTYISQRCPILKTIVLRADFLSRQGKIFAALVVNWKDLEVLGVGGSVYLVEILTQIGLHCKNFRSLTCSNSRIGIGEVSEIVKFHALKFLRVQESQMSRSGLVMILKQCKQLELLEVTKCIGFGAGDAEIRRLGSGISCFKCEECRGTIILDDE